LPPISHFRRLYLRWFSRPGSDRCIYRNAPWGQIHSIVELGLGRGRRALRLIELAAETVAAGEIRYTGIDLFEARTATDPPGLTMLDAYRLLKPTGVRVRLAPGDPYAALRARANELRQTDLLVISAAIDQDALAQAWFYIPRMLHSASQVFVETTGPQGRTAFRRLLPVHLEGLSASARPLRRAA